MRKVTIQERKVINPWTVGEKMVMVRMLAEGKGKKKFEAIADALRHKSVHDVVRLYYTQKHQLQLKEIRRALKTASGGGGLNREEVIRQVVAKGYVCYNMRANFGAQEEEEEEENG